MTKKPAEVRQGKGKGSVEYWAARVKPGRILFELDGVAGPLAAEAFERAAMKLPIKTKVVARLGDTSHPRRIMADFADLRTKTDDQLSAELTELKREQYNLRFRAATNQLEAPRASVRCAGPSRRSRRCKTSVRPKPPPPRRKE